jgi:hypothetical protein
MKSWRDLPSELTGHYSVWPLERPPSRLPHSYFWTWDHSTNWVLDDPGMQTWGCYNKYLKRPETYVEDYRRLTDLCAGLGIGGIVVWGFLRDSHGGIESARRVASNAENAMDLQRFNFWLWLHRTVHAGSLNAIRFDI